MPFALASLLSISLFAVSAAAGANHSLEYLLDLTKSSRPDTSPPDFDCSWRKLAYAYALHLQDVSPAKAKELHDALELSVLCGEPFHQPSPAAPAGASPASDSTVFVSPNGSDTAAGTLTAPFKTLAGALLHVRKASPAGHASIQLRGGTYHLDSGNLAQGIVLGPADSHLTISAYNNEPAVLSGGVELSGLEWAESEKEHIHVTTLTAAQAKLLPAKGATSLRVGGQRATRARFPNANPERDLFPKGYITSDTSWKPPVYPPYNTPESKPCGTTGKLCGESKTLDIPVKGQEWHGMYQNFTVGYGGACSVYSPPVSPWCSQDFYLCRQFKGGGAMHTRMPAGIEATPHLPNGPYKQPVGAHVFAWRPGHWYTW